MTDAKTIEIFLPDGDFTGIKIASIKTHLARVILVPRNKLKQAGLRKDFNKPGVYFLVTPSEANVKPRIYVGQAENCFERIKNHNITKDAWQTVLAVTAPEEKFGSTEIRFLEWHCWSNLKKSDGFHLENRKKISEPKPDESDRATLQSHFETIKLLLGALGYAFFEKTTLPAPNELLLCQSGAAKAQGVYTNNGLKVLKGSTSKLDLVHSAHSSIGRLRQSLIDEKVLVQDKDSYVFAQDYTFNSPSAAAAVVLGRDANGLIEWKYQNKETLKKRLNAV